MHALFALFLIFVVIFYQVVDYAISWISSLCASVCVCVYSFLLLILLLRIQCYLCFWYSLCCCSIPVYDDDDRWYGFVCHCSVRLDV